MHKSRNWARERAAAVLLPVISVTYILAYVLPAQVLLTSICDFHHGSKFICDGQ